MAKKNSRRTKITVDFILRISDKGTKDKGEIYDYSSGYSRCNDNEKEII